MVELEHRYDTWGNYGQHSGATDFAQINGEFVRCDELAGAEVVDSSRNSRKNAHELLTVYVDLPAGTLGRTVKTKASSRAASVAWCYWRVDAAGEKIELTHSRVTRNEALVIETLDILEDGTEILVGRAPFGVRTNAYPGHCGCVRGVAAGAGELRKAGGRWTVRCLDCFLSAAREQEEVSR